MTCRRCKVTQPLSEFWHGQTRCKQCKREVAREHHALQGTATTRPPATEQVPLGPLQEAFERSGRAAATVAMALDWLTPRGAHDGTRVMRALGLLPDTNSGTHRRWTSYERAVELAFAIGCDPHEVGV